MNKLDGDHKDVPNDPRNVCKNFVRRNSKYFNLEDGEEAEITYLDATFVTTNFKGREVDCLEYLIEVDGQEMKWHRSHRGLAEMMSCYQAGDVLRIKREGKGNQTKYFIQKVN